MEAEYEAIERRVIDTFPYPIAVNLAYARRARQADASDREFHHLLVTFEALIHLMGTVCLMDLVSSGSTTDGAKMLDEVLATAKNDFTPSLDRPNVGDWIHFITKSIPRIEQPFLWELEGWTKSDRKILSGRLNEMRDIRNGTSHPHSRPSLVQAQRDLPAFRSVLADALHQLEFLGDYTMFTAGWLNDDGEVLVTRLRGSTPPVESHWLGLTDALRPEDIVLADPDLDECLRLRPFYVAVEGQDDVDRIWAFGKTQGSKGENRYYIVDRVSGEPISTRRGLARPSDFLRRAAAAPERSPRIPLKASDSAKEELSANTRLPPELGYIVGVEELKRLPVSMSSVFEGRIGAQAPRGTPAENTELNLPEVGTRVIVKVARPDDTNVADNGCIRAEFELLRSISSDHVPKPYGLLLDEQGRNHLLLEYREGERLSTRLQSSRIDDEDLEPDAATATQIAKQLLTALAEVHRHGFHGDLKPSNILVSSNNRVSLIDFGAGRVDEDPATEMIPAFGTRGYVAPELFLPGDEDPDRKRSDLYSLGVILYELFAGYLPQMDAGHDGIDVSDMPGPRTWRLIVRWCGLVDPELRPGSVEDLVSTLESRARVPTEVGEAVTRRTIPARLWNGSKGLVVIAAVFASFMAALMTEDTRYLTFPVAGLVYLLIQALRGLWHDALREGCEPGEAPWFVAGVIVIHLLEFLKATAWVLGVLAVIVLGVFLLEWLEPLFDTVLESITNSGLRYAISSRPWLQGAIIVVLSLAGLAGLVFLQKRYEHAD